MSNEILVQASMNTEAIYGVKKCAEMVFKNARVIKREGLQKVQERLKALETNKVYKLKFTSSLDVKGQKN